MSDYDLLDGVETDEDGCAIRLKLQQRLDVPPSPFFTVSWRTEYSGTNKNRRFYWVDRACWTLPASTALNLLDRAAAKGMLDARYDDPYLRFGGGGPSFVDSRSLSPTDRGTFWREFTREGLEPAWGKAPSFVVATEAGGRWRKIMIVDEARQIATFRSCTTDASYTQRIGLPTTNIHGQLHAGRRHRNHAAPADGAGGALRRVASRSPRATANAIYLVAERLAGLERRVRGHNI